MMVRRPKPVNVLFYSFTVLLTLQGALLAATINVPGDQPTIQAGIDAAVSGVDEVVVAAGSYLENINLNGQAITLRSADGAATTTIDGTSIGPVITCSSGEGAGTVIQGFTILNGQNTFGGGLVCTSASPTVIDCIFRSNQANQHGGAVACQSNANPTFTNCLFTLNIANTRGGVFFNDSSSPTITNCTLASNQGFMDGAVYNQSGSAVIVNSIIWSNTPPINQINDPGGLMTVSFSDIQGGWTGSGANNISINPEFEDQFNGDFHLQDTSPCIDAGDNSQVPAGITTDLDGTTRFLDVPLTPDTGQGTPPIVDMGVFEAFADCNGNQIPDDEEADSDNDTVPDDCDVCPGFDDLVDTDGDGFVDGCDLCPSTTAGVGVDANGCPFIENVTTGVGYNTIQLAIDEALNGHEIVCRPRTYVEAIDFLGKTITVRSDSGDPNDTIIDGNGAFHVVQCVNGEGPDTLLQGFTITGGNANGSNPNNRGGGMYNDGSSPTVDHCTFSGNSSAGQGGGMFNTNNSNPTVTNCAFNGNSTDIGNNGGGMYNNGSSPTIAHCTFSGNSATLGGGMFNDSNSNATITHCVFTNNSANSEGGGMFNFSGSPTIAECTFSGNSASQGGGMLNNNSSPTVTNCTFSDNTATGPFGEGGGMRNHNSSPTIADCIFSGNSATSEGGGMHNDNSSPTVSNCTFSGNSSDFGGGMRNASSSSPTVSKCIFSENTAGSWGGGMYNRDNTPTVTHCSFIDNSTNGIGGGMYNLEDSSMVTNCTFTGNSADFSGGGMYNEDSTLTVSNCTFSGNSAVFAGGGMTIETSTPTVTNCILWGNSPGEISSDTSVVLASYSDIQGGYPGMGNIDVDPLFADANGADNIVGTLDDNLRLQAGSPCIDAGNSVFVPLLFPTDLDGNARISDDPATVDTGVGFPEVVDMGAYEFGSTPPPCIPQIPGDINCDGIVNELDFALMALHWLETI
jgi:predicted outer membrane repeat protein